jgi:hypothetical protein
MLDIDGFFKKHGCDVLKFDVKIGSQVTRLEFTRDFVLGADRTNPWALQERLDEGSAKAAMYGTLATAAKAQLKQTQRAFKAWYAPVHRDARAELIKASNESNLAYGLKKAPTAEDVENAIANGPHGVELQKWYERLDALENDRDQMDVLYKAADLDAQAARSMSSMGKAMLERDMIGPGAPRQLKPNEPKKPSDADF